MEFKPDMDMHKDPDNDKFTTTFSNSPCWPNYCLRQSYPEHFHLKIIRKLVHLKLI